MYDLTAGKLLGQTTWATGKFTPYDRNWMGPLTLKGHTLTGRSPNGWTFTATF